MTRRRDRHPPATEVGGGLSARMGGLRAAEQEAATVAASVATSVAPSPASPESSVAAVGRAVGSQLGMELAGVKLHTDSAHGTLAAQAEANAYTLGGEIGFAAGTYTPGTVAGNRLLAHEMTHVVQQRRDVGLRSVMLMQGARPIPDAAPSIVNPSDLKTSAIGGKIRKGLAGVGSRDRPDGGVTPAVDPEKVLDILATSPSFLEDAEFAEDRNPELKFDFHQEPDRGTFAEKVSNTIVVHVETLDEVVSSLVHEVRHASGQAPEPRIPKGTGDIAALEMGGVEEEIDTRKRQATVLEELNLPGETGSTEAAKVRAGFWSGRPKLTYQELFIVDAMKLENRIAAVADDPARLRSAEKLARKLVPPVDAPSAGTADKFSINAAQHRMSAAKPPLPDPPSLGLAKQWMKQYGSRFYPGKNPDRIKGAPEGVVEFLDLFFDFTTNEDLLLEKIKVHSEKQRRLQAEIDLGAEVTSFIDGLPPGGQDRGIPFLEWVMIGEALGRDWGTDDEAGNWKRQRHLDFLVRRLGSRLFGLDRPRTPRPRVTAPPPPRRR
jgi:hypothetical protein